jgi:hypothetical protein
MWFGLLWIVGLVVFFPASRLSMQAYAGGLWIVVAWFFLARTKTLTWGGLIRFFSLCLPWSAAVAVITTRLADQSYSYMGVSLEQGVEAVGAMVAIAGIAEECLKLVPVAILVALAPRRSTRFAAADWLLLGLASGTAFLVTEEVLRRLALESGSLGLSGVVGASVSADGLPIGWPRFGWLPLPKEWVREPTAFGVPLGGDAHTWFAGHTVATAIVVGLAGLAIVVWRGGSHWRRPVRWLARLAALVVPALVLWSLIADHAMFNADPFNSIWQSDGVPYYLDPSRTTIPWWLRLPWAVLGYGRGRYVVFFIIAAVCVVVDAQRLVGGPSVTGQTPPRWVGASSAKAQESDARQGDAAMSFLTAARRGLLAPVWIAVRDWRDALAGFTRDKSEPRRAALARGFMVVSGQRALREFCYEVSGRGRPWLRRTVAIGLLAVLLAAAMLLSPQVAESIGAFGYDGFWLAGVASQLAEWWNELPLMSKISLIVGVLSLIALPFFSGGAVMYVLMAVGVADWMIQHRQAVVTAVLHPRQAWRDFWNLSPVERVLETFGFILTFWPGGILGRRAVPAARSFANELAADSRGVLRDLPDTIRGKAGAYGVERYVLGRRRQPFGTPQHSSGVELIDSRRAPIGEIDRVDLPRGTFIEDKSAHHLVGESLSATQVWAQKHVYNKTATRIEALLDAAATRVTKHGSPAIPDLTQIQGVRHFVFHLEADSPELRQAVYEAIRRLRLRFPDFSFEAAFGVPKKGP